MRRRPTPPAMSLFPFLDTLVCTMGALILMLLAMTPKIKERAQARLQAQMAAQSPAASVEPDPEPEPEPASQPASPTEPEPVLEKVAFVAVPDKAQAEEQRAAERKARREAWFRSAAEARDKLAARQAEHRHRRQLIKEADQRLKGIQDQILKSQLKADSVDKADESLSAAADRLEAQQERVAQEIARTRKNIDLLNRRQAVAKNEYSLVPYDGTSGTVRRPVYIECTGKGFRFLPEDESVSPADLEGFPENYNPLLTGAQSLVRFWARRRRNSPQSEPEPYVLLLVRPSGCFTYYVARKYLSSLNVNFGYELIEEDWKLSIADPDPVAKSLLKETLDTTVQSGRPSRNSMADAGRGGFDGFDGAFGRGDRSNGFGPSTDDDNWGSPGRGEGRGDGRGDGRGEGRGDGRGDGSGDGPGNGPSGNGPSGNGPSGNGPSGNGNGSGPGTGRKPGVKFGPATRAGRTTAVGAADDDPLAGGGDGTGTTNGTVYAAGAKTAGRAGGSSSATRGAKAAGMSGSSRTGTGTGAGDSDTEEPSHSTLAVSRTRPATGSGSATFGNAIAENAIAGNAIAETNNAATGETGTSLNPFDQSGGSPGSPNGSTSRGSRSGSSSGALSKTSPPSGATSSNSSAANDSGSTGSSSANPATANASAGGSASSVQFGGPGATVSLGSNKKSKLRPKDDEPDDGPRISEDNGKTGGPTGRSRGPRQWGKAGNKATTGYERRIEVRLSADRILVGSKDVAVPVKRDDSADEIVQRVVNAIEYVADKWAEPPEGFYWVPAVRFVVYPGGDAYSEKLGKVLEQKYSVNSTIEFADDKPIAAEKPVKKAAPRGKP